MQFGTASTGLRHPLLPFIFFFFRFHLGTTLQFALGISAVRLDVQSIGERACIPMARGSWSDMQSVGTGEFISVLVAIVRCFFCSPPWPCSLLKEVRFVLRWCFVCFNVQFTQEEVRPIRKRREH